MRVLGVDPGLTRCGLGVVDGAPGRPLTLVAVDVVRTPRRRRHRRAGWSAIERGRRGLARPRTSPDAVAVERVFSQHNVRTVMGTAQASAVAIVAAARRGLPVALHTPSEVKAAVTGSGRADKAQVGAMVTRLLRPRRAPAPGRRRRRARAGDLPRLARRAPRPRIAAAVAAQPGRRPPDDRLRDAAGSPRSPPTARCRGRRGRARRAVHARPRSPALRLGEPARLPTSLVVREDSLTLYGFADDDERRRLRAAADRQRGRAAARPGDARRAQPRRAAPRRRRPRTSPRSSQVPGIGRKGAQRIVLELKDRLGAPGRRRRGRPAGAAGARRTAGATRCTPRCSGWAGRPARPTTPWPASPYADEASARTSRRTSPPCSRLALRTLSRA